MDRYFYSIELDENGSKVIHLFCNIYWNDADQTDTDYRYAEWTFLYISMDKLRELIENDGFYEYINERIGYLGDLTKKEATTICDHYFKGLLGFPSIELSIKSINEHTLCGNYWFEAEGSTIYDR